MVAASHGDDVHGRSEVVHVGWQRQGISLNRKLAFVALYVRTAVRATGRTRYAAGTCLPPRKNRPVAHESNAVVSTCRHTHHALVALADTDHDWIGLKALGACVATETELVVRACSGSEHAFAMDAVARKAVRVGVICNGLRPQEYSRPPLVSANVNLEPRHTESTCHMQASNGQA
jgi:hypothetical protein